MSKPMSRVLYVLLATLFLLSLASAASFSDSSSISRVTYQTPPSFQTYYGSEGRASTYWPILDNVDQCGAREDILLQVAPGGCQPAVVRSDLLAEQNVPVFCQINALSLNPLIDIKELQSIRFRGSYPENVIGAGFHPARAAIRTRDKLLGDPLINNVGYVVLVLKKQEQESKLPSLVNVTLQAQIEYESGNAFGVGRAEFILEPVTESDWQNEKLRQSFWKGEYYIRLEHADSNQATVTLYHGDRKVSSVNVQKGTPSKTIYMPGYYCRAGLQVVYDGFISSQKRARLDVVDSSGALDSIDVYEGSRFLNDRCTVTRISTSGVPDSGNVSITCNGGQRFILSLKPRVDQLMNSLRNAANEPVTPTLDTGYWVATLASGTYGVKEQPDGILYYRASTSTSWTRAPEGKTTNEKLQQNIIREALEYYSSLDQLGRTSLNVNGASLQDRTLTPIQSEQAFNAAVSSYEKVAADYPLEKGTSASSPYGQQSLQNAISLTETPGVSKDRTLLRLLEQLTTLYPNAPAAYLNHLRSFYGKDNVAASATVEIENSFKTITLSSIILPKDSSGATFSFAGTTQTISIPMSENRTVRPLRLNGNLENVYVDEVIDEEKVKIRYECRSTSNSGLGTLRSGSMTLSVLDNAVDICTGSRIKLERVDVKEVAKIRLLPFVRGTKSETNLTVAVGIEKRAIQLSPDKTLERISRLNESIKNWEQINNNLGNLVSGLKAACFVTAATLTAKSFISGSDGSSLARQQTMQGENGWNNQCKRLIESGQYKTPTECFNANKANIEEEVKQRTQVIEKVNKDIASIEDNPSIKQGNVVSGYSVDSIEAQRAFIQKLKAEYPNDVFVKELKEPSKDSPSAYSYTDLREWYANKQLESSVPRAKLELEKIEQRVRDQTKSIVDLEANKNKPGLEKYSFYTQSQQRELEGKLLAITHDGSVTKVGGLALSSQSSATIDSSATHAAIVSGKVNNAGLGTPTDNGYYLVVGSKPNGGNTLVPSAVYSYKTDASGAAIISSAPSRVSTNPLNFYADNNIKSLKEGGSEFSSNQIGPSDRVVRYFETGPDKNMPAVVPFDVTNGWYVRVKSNLNIGNQIAAYDSSGLPKAWWICNVGANKGIDTSDECQQIIATSSSSTAVLGLDDTQSRRLIEQSRKALLDAAAQKGNKIIRINGQDLYQGAPATQFDNVQCQDFMSADDCKLLFNVCDPVICPATRCDFGRQYPVADVIQSGIVGSTLLCLPNYREGIYVPVCLSGIHAGIESYLSVLKSHRDCLSTSVSTGKMVGICDEVYSIYACEFFWRQIAPIANVLLPKIVEFAYGKGQGARGGGEYLTVMGAWQNTQKSIDYFTQTYAVNSLQAFRLRSTDEIGSQFCKGFVSMKGVSSVKSLVTPDSPPQFFASFDTIKFSDVTVPATAQYKVYYHIFAGKDAGVYYSVYLKSPPDSSYYYNAPYVTVASGFITQGQSADETKDFTAPEGYKELCVRINDKEECGFKQVTTDMGVNYLRDQYIAEEIKDTSITTESTCISGSTRIGTLLNPSIQSGAEETALPQIAERGVVRICASRNPGSTTEPTRYVEVGYCTDKNIKCWLDQKSVSNAITDNNIGVKNATLSSLEQYQKELLAGQGVILTDIAANDAIYTLARDVEAFALAMEQETDGTKASAAGSVILNASQRIFGASLEQLTLNHHKAEVLFYTSKVKAIISQVYLRGKAQQIIATKGSVSGNDLTDTSPDTTHTPSAEHEDTEANAHTPGSVSYTLQTGQVMVSSGTIDAEYLSADGTILPVYLLGGKLWIYQKQPYVALRSLNAADRVSIGSYSTSGTLDVDFVALDAAVTTGAITSISSEMKTHLQALNGKQYDSLKKTTSTPSTPATTTPTTSSSTTTTPSTTTPSTTSSTNGIVGLAYYDGYNDMFVFRWNVDHVEAKGKIRWAATGFGLGITGDIPANWVTDPNAIQGFAADSVVKGSSALYDYERTAVIEIMAAKSWSDAVFEITKAALTNEGDVAVYFPKDTTTNAGLFDDSDTIDTPTYNDVKQKIGL